MKTTLTIEESAHLIELGVDAKMASKKEFVDIHPEVLKGNAEYARPWGWIPRFTLTDILSILPKEINDKGLQTKMQLEPCLNEDEENAPRWAVSYYDYYTDANL